MHIFRRFRLHAGMTQGDLAEKLGVRQSTISGYEAGTRQPRRYVMERFIPLARKHDFELTIESLYQQGHSQAAA